MNKDKSKYGIFIATFMLAIVIFSMYILNFINKNEQIKSQIGELTRSIDLKSNSITLFLIIICIITLLMLFIVNLIVNNVILKIIKVNIDSMKLATGILISYNLVFLLGNLLITYTDIKLLWLTLISNLIEIIIFLTLFSEELDKSKYKYVAVRLGFVIVNMLISYFTII